MRSLDTSARLSRDKDLDRIVERGSNALVRYRSRKRIGQITRWIGGLVVVVALVSAAFYWASSEIRVPWRDHLDRIDLNIQASGSPSDPPPSKSDKD